MVDALAQRKEESLEFKERAIEAFNVQNFKRAEQHLSSAIELDPENHVFYSNRAAAYMAMEKFDRALKDANECVRLQPTWAKGYSRQAAALLSMGDLPAAREACLKGLDLEPDNVQARARPASPPAPPAARPPPPAATTTTEEHFAIMGGLFPDPNHDSSPRTTTPATTGKPRNRGEISAHSPAADFP